MANGEGWAIVGVVELRTSAATLSAATLPHLPTSPPSHPTSVNAPVEAPSDKALAMCPTVWIPPSAITGTPVCVGGGRQECTRHTLSFSFPCQTCTQNMCTHTYVCTHTCKHPHNMHVHTCTRTHKHSYTQTEAEDGKNTLL